MIIERLFSWSCVEVSFTVEIRKRKPELNKFFDHFPQYIVRRDGDRTLAILPLVEAVGNPVRSHLNKFFDQFADQVLPGIRKMNAGRLAGTRRG
ncbi:hypothetical protein AFL94_16725 [Arthrobacter sp. LS16]|nr:hypothetical protein AFL94_16725 [Arthrobacter sp. LS16]